jgi:hypothetical protein
MKKADESKFEVEKDYIGPHLLPPNFVDAKFVQVNILLLLTQIMMSPCIVKSD